jgi:hypothetical protein
MMLRYQAFGLRARTSNESGARCRKRPQNSMRYRLPLVGSLLERMWRAERRRRDPKDRGHHQYAPFGAPPPFEQGPDAGMHRGKKSGCPLRL